MINFLVVFIMYTGIWVVGMYFILHRIYFIRKRTEKHLRDYDGDYIPPTYGYAWASSILLGVGAYIISVLILFIFFRV